MATKKPIPIRAVLGYARNKPADILARLNAVLSGVYTDTEHYPNPPYDQATFKSNTDTYSARITAALDGGLKAIAERNQQEDVVVQMLHDVAHYAEMACKGNMAVFLKSGFEAASSAAGKFQPLSQAFRSINPGDKSGEVLVSINAFEDASAHELRWASVGAGGVLGSWTIIPVGKLRPPTLVTGLTPGTNYAFHVRGIVGSGYTDWSDSVTRMSM